MKYHYFVTTSHQAQETSKPHVYRAEIATKKKILYFKQIEELEKRLIDRIYRNKKIKVKNLIITNYILLRKEPKN